MRFHLDDIMTGREHLAALDVPDPARDSAAERHDAARIEIDGFLSSLPDWQQLLSYRLHEITAKADRLLDDARAAFASDPSGELPYGAEISSDYEPVDIAPDYCPDPPGPVPVVLFRSQLRGGPTIERHYAFGSRTLPVIAAEALEAVRSERGCDLRMFGPTGLHDSVTKRSSRFIWPELGHFGQFARLAVR